MKKVCHVTSVHTRYDVRIFEKECRFLSRLGWDVSLLVNDCLPDEEKEGVHIRSTNQKTTSRVKRMTRDVRKILHMAEKMDADIYHIHDPELLPIATKLAQSGRKVIFDSHEFTAMQILTKSYLPTFTRKLLSKAYKKYEGYVLKFLSGIISPCEYDGRDYFENVCENKVYINNYPIMEENPKSIVDVRNRERKVCYIGALSEARGIIPMIKAAHMAKIPLILGGEFSPELYKRVEEMPEFECVEYIGTVPHEKALEIISKCAVGISVLQDEGQYSALYNLPTKVYEYMSLGIPVVISDFPYVQQVLGKYEFGIAVKPSDEKAIAAAIQKLVGDPSLAEHMGEEGKRAITKEMNWEKEVFKLDCLYHEILK